MKNFIIIALLALLAGAGFLLYKDRHPEEANRIEEKAKTAGETIKDTAVKAWDATKGVATNVTSEIKEGAQKVGEKIKGTNQ